MQDSHGIVAEGDASTNYLSAITSLMPRLCGQLKLPYLVQNRATEIYKEWAKHGVKAASPQTIAACAVQSAIEEKTTEMTNAGIPHPPVVRGQIIDGLAEAAGIAASTILKTLKDLRAEMAKAETKGEASTSTST